VECLSYIEDAWCLKVNLKADTTKILILQQLRKPVPSVEILEVKHADLKDMFKEAFKSVCTSTVVILPNTFSPTTSTYSVIHGLIVHILLILLHT